MTLLAPSEEHFLPPSGIPHIDEIVVTPSQTTTNSFSIVGQQPNLVRNTPKVEFSTEERSQLSKTSRIGEKTGIPSECSQDIIKEWIPFILRKGRAFPMALSLLILIGVLEYLYQLERRQ